MSYKRVNWINDSEPDLSAENLNIMDKGIENVDIGLSEADKKIEKLSSEVESATAELDKKISNAQGAVATENIADKSITSNKLDDTVTSLINSKANATDLQTVSENVSANTAAIAQKANNSDLQTVSSQVTANTKALSNVYTKSDIKSRFAQGISAIYDSAGNIVKATDLSTLSGGALAGDTTITTAFIANNVTHLQSGCFAGCSNLQTVYIDNIQGKITVQSGAIPSTATIIYTDEFNPVTANAKAILALRSSIGDINNALTELSALADSYITDTTAATSEEVQ